MKFVLTTGRRATMPVEALLPTDTGTKAKIAMKVTFELLSDDEFQEMRAPKGDGTSVLAQLAQSQRNIDAELLRRAVVDWSSDDLVDEAGEPVPFSAEALETICQHVVPLRFAMALAYVRAHEGEAKKGN